MSDDPADGAREAIAQFLYERRNDTRSYRLVAELTSDAVDTERRRERRELNAEVARALSLPEKAEPEPDDDWEARSERSYIDNTAPSLSSAHCKGGDDAGN